MGHECYEGLDVSLGEREDAIRDAFFRDDDEVAVAAALESDSLQDGDPHMYGQVGIQGNLGGQGDHEGHLA